MTLNLCVAQLNLTVGDLAGNAEKIIASARRAYARGVRLVVTPELSICGYPPQDLLLRPAFVADCEAAVQALALALADLPGLHVIVGHPCGDGYRDPCVSVPARYNAASVLCEGRRLARYAKQELPNYQVFDERRYFAPGQGSCVFRVGGVAVGLLICEDAWFDAPARQAQADGAQMLVVMNASPWHWGKGAQRQAQMGERVRSSGLPLVYAHCVGAQDEIVFEGASFALQADAQLAGQAPSFVECDWDVCAAPLSLDANPARLALQATISAQADAYTELWNALVLGLRDYVRKNGFSGAVLGLSGGVDSALVLALAVDALGRDKVRAVMMPSPYTAEISLLDAAQMAKRLGVRYDVHDIAPMVAAFGAALEQEFAGLAQDATEENIQARVRGTLLMALSNKFGLMVLATGNKSEMATGYCTLYGDMAGGFAVIKDVTKTRVYALCQWRNAHDPYGSGANPIPERILTRAPSAELRPNQTDQDSLPPYDVVDAIVQRYMENDESPEEIVAAGFASADVQRVTQLIVRSEYKRAQAAPGVRVTHRSFGKDWRYPITSRYRA